MKKLLIVFLVMSLLGCVKKSYYQDDGDRDGRGRGKPAWHHNYDRHDRHDHGRWDRRDRHDNRHWKR